MMRWLALVLIGCGGGSDGMEPPVPDAHADAVDAPAAVGGNLVFVTAELYAPGGGLAGADAICMQEAAAAGHAGTFVAWLSSDTVAAADRLAGSQGWVRADGRPFVSSVEDLLAGRIFHPIDHTADGELVIGTSATGTTADGMALSSCNGWTSTANADRMRLGNTAGTTRAWTETVAEQPCDSEARLYCFGLGKTVEVRPADTGPLAFVTEATWAPGGGITSADAVCQAEADAAGKPGTFRALLASPAGFGLERLGGGRWVRADGVLLLDDGETSFHTTVNVTLAGEYVTGRAWSGHPQLDRCQEWMSSSSSDTGTAVTSELAKAGYVATCDSAFRLRCLED